MNCIHAQSGNYNMSICCTYTWSTSETRNE